MSDAFGRLFSSFLQQLVFLVTMAILFAPQVVSAESLLLLFNDNPGQSQEVIRKSAKQSTILGLNKNGDMEIRHGDISLVMAYNAPNEIIEPQERLRKVQSQDIPTINGISLRVNFSF